MRLEGRVAIVTGGGQGLGEAFSRRFADEGAKIAVVDIDESKAATVANHIKQHGGEAMAIKTDVAQVDQVEAMVAEVLDRFGTVDILVNSAGVLDAASTEDTTEAVWDRTLDINLKGLFFATRAVVPEMRRKGGGKVINMTSIAGLVGFLNCPAYCASKGGIVNLTKALACELAEDRINVNAIAPGPVDTPINLIFGIDSDKGDAHRQFLKDRTPMKVDFFTVEDIVGTALYLASADSNAVTGVTIPVDGGWCAW